MSTHPVSYPVTPSAVSGLRIGDQERDRAAECLREHLATGRLDPDEFDQRLEVALTARVEADLEPLFIDLPAPHPNLGTGPSTGTPSRPSPADRDGRHPSTRDYFRWNLLLGLVWTATISICAARGGDMWWLFYLPFIMSILVHRQRRHAARGCAAGRLGAGTGTQSGQTADWHDRAR